MYLEPDGRVVISEEEVALCLAVGRRLGLTDEQLERVPDLLREHADQMARAARWQ
jgi:hypothetical protein